jgi:phage terminase large subunit
MAAVASYLAVYEPLQWQLEPLYDKSPTLLITGSAGGGKSRVAAEKINAYCWHYPRSTWLVCRKAREWNKHSIVPFMWNTVMGQDQRIKFNVSEGAFYYPNESVIYSAGMYDEKQRQAARSIGGDGGLDGAWLEEANAFTRQDYEEIIGRVRHTAADWQQIILTTNPDSPSHWIYKDLIAGGNASVYYSGASDNPYNSPAYLANLEKLTGVMRDRLVLGKWVQAEGAIYNEYDPALHVIDPGQCPEFIRRFRVIDFGYSNPFVCQWWGMDADGRMYRYREIYQTRRLVEDLTKEIVNTSKPR